MNKYLMMSAAVLMGTAAIGVPQASAVTGPVHVALNNVSNTFAYCDAFSVYKQGSHSGNQYAAVHNYSGCYGTSAYNLPSNGHQLFKLSGGVSGYTGSALLMKKSINLADITFPELDGFKASLEFQLSMPLGSAKGQWACWYSTNGVTALWCNNGRTIRAGGVTNKHKESSTSKLASILSHK